MFLLHDAPLRNWLAVRSEIPQSLSLALSALHVKVMKGEKVLDADIKGLMDALALETRFVDLCALQDDAAGNGGLIAGVGVQMPVLPAPAAPAGANKSGDICLNHLRARGCRHRNCRFGHYDSTNTTPKSSLEEQYKNLAGYKLNDPGDLVDSKVRGSGMSMEILRAALLPFGSPRPDRQPKKGKKDNAALIAAVREVLTGVSAPPVVAGAVPAAAVQATAFSLLPVPPPASSPDVAAAISTISSQVTDQQRNVFLSLSDKEFRDHFAKTFGL